MGDTGFILAAPGENVAVDHTDSATQSSDDTRKTEFSNEDHCNDVYASPQINEGGMSSKNDTQEFEKMPEKGQELAIHFSSWFFRLLDSIATSGSNTDWGPQHFWPGAELTVQCNEPSGLQETTVLGADFVSDKFLSMLLVDQLYFNPNLSNDSVKGQQNPHGLVVVMVCGTVHRHKEYLGVFEQSFGLIRDPCEENNWKIKFSKLKLKASGLSWNNRLKEEESQTQPEEPA